MMSLEDMARAVPKCELHVHLDGSLSSEFIARRAAARGIVLPPSVGPGGAGLREYMHTMKADQIRQGHKAAPGRNWDIFTFCNQFLQTREELTEATIDLLSRFHSENVKLCELRFCPLLHCLEGLTAKEAALAVSAGVVVARERLGMLGGVILCGLRSHRPEDTLAVAKLCVELAEETSGVVLGFDIAGDEGSYPIVDHVGSIQFAHNAGCRVTVHAGEWPVSETDRSSLDNLKLVLRSGLIDRVGHGIQIVAEEDFLQEFVTSGFSGIPFECCLTANVGWKIKSYETHPIKQMKRAGVKVTLNCDNTLLSGAADRCAHPSGEVIRFVRDVGMESSDLGDTIMNSARASFVFGAQKWREDEKMEWIRGFEVEMRSVLEKYDSSLRSTS